MPIYRKDVMGIIGWFERALNMCIGK
jgi:hypothetical protein